jgi:hypothetical protein
MADDTITNAGTGGDTLATDQVTLLNGAASSIPKVIRVKMMYGDDGSARDASLLYPMPVTATTSIPATQTGAAGAAVTLTIPAPAAGLFNYIQSLHISLYASAARTGAAAPVIVTTTNLPGAPAFNFPTAQAIGSIDRDDQDYVAPVKSITAATATTFVAPVATSGIWRITATYYQAP